MAEPLVLVGPLTRTLDFIRDPAIRRGVRRHPA